MTWDLSCPDWAEQLRAGRAPIRRNLPLSPEGDRAVTVFNKLRLADVPGVPTMAEAGGDWFRDIVRTIWGALDPVTRARAIRELMLLVPKKNSKTTNGALLSLTALLLNERPNASLILTAPVKDVAELAYDAAAGAVELDATLKKLIHTKDHKKMLVHRQSGAELSIMTFDPATLTGQKPVWTLIDELHVISKMAKAASAIRQLRGGMLPFPEAVLAFITTQSEEAPSGVMHAELQKARAIRDGTQTGVMLPVLYEFPEAMQKDPESWSDPENWSMVTPNEGRSISIPRLVEEYETAKATSAEELRAWASQHLNVEIGLALHSNRWSGADHWEACGSKKVTLEALMERCEVIVGGVDGGGLDDLLGLAFMGRDEKTKEWLHWAHAWAHPSVLERRKSEAPKFKDFESDGDLTIVENIGDDVTQVAEYVMKVEATGLLDQIGVDAVGISDILDALIEAKFDEKRIVAIPQGWRLVGAIKTAERQLAAGTFLHGGTRLMAYCVGNAKAVARGNAVLITKETAGAAKIDPLIATFNCVSLLGMNPKARKKKYQILIY